MVEESKEPKNMRLLALAALLPFVRTGKFKLRSGRESDLYIDVKGALLSNNGIRINGALYNKLYRILSERTLQRFDPHFVGYGYGGAILCSSMLPTTLGKCTLFRGEKKDYGLSNKPIGELPELTDTVVILEDVVTTESSIRECIAALRASLDDRLPINLHVVVVVDRRREEDKTFQSVISLFTEEDIRKAVASNS